MKKKERKLSQAEQARADRLVILTQEMEEKGFVRRDQVISILFANVMALILSIPFLVPLTVWFIKRNGLFPYESGSKGLLFPLVLVILIVVHELIHGLFWGLCAEHHFSRIEFGFMKENLTPYCTCGEPLGKRAYLLGCLMPLVLVGILPSVFGVLHASIFWFLQGIVMIMGAGGDMTIALKMLTYRTSAREVILLDHPTECGYISFERD